MSALLKPCERATYIIKKNSSPLLVDSPGHCFYRKALGLFVPFLFLYCVVSGTWERCMIFTNLSCIVFLKMVKHKTSALWKCLLWKMFSCYQLFVSERFHWIIVCFMACYLHDCILRTCFPLSLYCTVSRMKSSSFECYLFSWILLYYSIL